MKGVTTFRTLCRLACGGDNRPTFEKSSQRCPQGSGTFDYLCMRLTIEYGRRSRAVEAVLDAIGPSMHPFLHTSHIISAPASV